MLRAMTADVTVKTVEPTPTAVVAAATTWAEFPAMWRPMLDKVWGFLRVSAPGRAGRHRYPHRPDRQARRHSSGGARVEQGERVQAGWPSLGDLRRSRPVERPFRRARVLVAGDTVTRTFLAGWLARSRRQSAAGRPSRFRAGPHTITAADPPPGDLRDALGRIHWPSPGLQLPVSHRLRAGLMDKRLALP